jgi:hypothetical protein
VGGPGGKADEMLSLIAKVYAIERRLRERYEKQELGEVWIPGFHLTISALNARRAKRGLTLYIFC